MSTTLSNVKWEPLSDYTLDEWLPFKDEVIENPVNDPFLKSEKCETAEQVLHDYEDIGKTDTDYWLEEFPLFDEIESLNSLDDNNPIKLENNLSKLNEINTAGNVNISDAPKLSPNGSDIFASSQENSTTFIISNDNILYIESPEYFTTLQSSGEKSFKTLDFSTIIKDEDEAEKSFSSDLEPEFSKANNVSDVNSEISKEMEVVDEIIRSTALELDQFENETSSSSSEASSTIGSDFSPKMREEDNSDPEWKPEPLKISRSKRSQGRKEKFYCRGGSIEDKKQRKKEQNKNAATRYRQKKKAEVSEILREEEELKEKKAKLEEKVVDIQNEIKYLKGLMRDLFKAKGLIN